MAKGKSLVLILAAMTMSLMFVASATSPILNESGRSGDQASDIHPCSIDDGILSGTPDKAATKETANGAKCCDKKAPLKDASGLSVLRGKVLDMKTGKPVAGALVVMQPVDAGAEVNNDPACLKGPTSVQSTGCDKMEATGGCCGNCGAPDAPAASGSTRPEVEPTKPPVPSASSSPPMPVILPQNTVPQPLLQTKSDVKGLYSIKIKPGDFILNVIAEGYVPYFGEVGVPKATKFDHDVALEPAPVPDCRIDGFITDAADGKRLPSVDVLIIRLPADFPISRETLREMVAGYLGEKPLETAMTPEQAAEMKEKEAQRQTQDSNGQLTEEQILQMKEKLAQEQNTDANGQLTDEYAQENEKKTSEGLDPKVPQNGCPEKPPLPPVPTLPKDPSGIVMPDTISLLTDQKGHFETKLFSGRVLVIAFARGYNPQWVLLDLPAKSSISVQLKLDRSLPQETILSEPVPEPPNLPDMEGTGTPPKPR